MLQRIRDNASGPLAYVVVAVIALVFGVWGIGSYFTPSADPVVASVGSTDITRYQLQQSYNQRYQRLRQIMGDNFDPSVLPPPKQLRRTVLQNLIDDAVLEQYAEDAGYRVTDGALLAALRGDRQFQVDGEFSAQRYKALLSQAGMSPAQYESRLRDSLKSRQIRAEIGSSAFAAPAEVDQAYRLANQQRKLSVLQFDPADYRDAVSVDDAAIKQYYDDHPDRYQRPERVKLAYVELDRGSIPAGDAVDEDQLRQLYQQNKQRFGTPEKRSGGEIRVPIGDDDSAARERIQQVTAALDQGRSFDEVANSVDGAEYRALDARTQQSLPAAVGEALFGLKPGAVSTPVKTDDAWLVVKLGDVTPAQQTAFEDEQVQKRLKAMARERQANEAFSNAADRLESLAYEAPNDLATLHDELDLEVQHSDWISRDQGSGIGQYDAVRKAAFSDAVLKDKLNSTPIQLGSDRRIVLRVDERQPAERKPLEAVRADIEKRLVAQRATQKAQDAADSALKQLQAGKASLDQIAADTGAKLSAPGFVGRGDRNLDPRVREAAFALPKPSSDAARYDVTPTSSGRVALVAVSAVRLPNDDEGAQQRKQFASQQRNYIAQLEYSAFSAYLREHADIEINEDRID